MDASEALRADLRKLLGGWPEPAGAVRPIDAAGAPVPPAPSRPADRDGTTHRVAVPSLRRTARDADDALPGLFVRPPGPGPFPTVLYCHAHGHDHALGKGELVGPRRSLPSGPWGPALAARGIASLSIDQPGFGERRGQSESSLAKRYLWWGDTLFGAMLRELASALDWLGAHPEVDASRVATLGLSMGCTTAWWLGALDGRVAAVAGLCCLADVGELVRTGAHELHGIYLTVPGLLARTSTAEIAGLVAPRPQLVAVGEADPLTPPVALAAALGPLRAAYADAGAPRALEVVREPGGGHRETPRMRAETLGFLDRHLLGRHPAPSSGAGPQPA